MTDMREEFERIAKETHQIINFSRYEDYLIAAEYGREVGDYCVPFVRDLWQGYQMAIAARTGGEVEPVFKIMHGPKGSDGNPEWVEFMSLTDADSYHFPHGTELYTHPTPAAAVPDGFSVERRPDCIVITRHSDMGAAAYSKESGLVTEVMGWYFLDALLPPSGHQDDDSELEKLESSIQEMRRNGLCDIKFSGPLDLEGVRLTRPSEAAPQPVGDGEPDYKALYNELLYSVETKHPGESRHQTALKYICNAERGSDRAFLRTAKPPEGEQ